MNKSLFLNTEKFQFSTAPKLTCNHKFYPRNLTVSLQKALSFSKLCNLASAVQLPFRTDSNPHRRYPESSQYPVRPVIWWTPVISVKISNRTEIWIVPGSPEGRNPRSPWNMVALLTSVRNSPCFGGLRRTKTCHWQLFARPSRKFVPAGTTKKSWCICISS